MSLGQSLLFFLVSLGSSVVGAICGIGGGVIIKPILDFFGWASISTISFLSGCTVLCMSGYSVSRSLLAEKKSIDPRLSTYLAVGAVLGGTTGKNCLPLSAACFRKATW